MDTSAITTNFDQLLTQTQNVMDQGIQYQQKMSDMSSKFQADQSAITMMNSIVEGIANMASTISRNISN